MYSFFFHILVPCIILSLKIAEESNLKKLYIFFTRKLHREMESQVLSITYSLNWHCMEGSTVSQKSYLTYSQQALPHLYHQVKSSIIWVTIILRRGKCFLHTVQVGAQPFPAIVWFHWKLTGVCCEREDGGKDGVVARKQKQRKRGRGRDERWEQTGNRDHRKLPDEETRQQVHVRNKRQWREKGNPQQTVLQTYPCARSV